MKNKFLRMAGVETEQEFYDMFPTEEAFFEAYPEATQMKKGGNVPTNPQLYSRVKSEMKKKFETWPSAYGSAALVREYKRRGGKYRKAQYGMEVSPSTTDNTAINRYNPYEAGVTGNLATQSSNYITDQRELADSLIGASRNWDKRALEQQLFANAQIKAGKGDRTNEYYSNGDILSFSEVMGGNERLKKADTMRMRADQDYSRAMDILNSLKRKYGGNTKGQFGGMMGGLNPENPFAGAVGNIMQQQQQQGQGNSQLLGAAMKFAPMLMGMPPMADGGKMPAWLAEKRFKAAGNTDKLDDYGYMYGGDVEMGYGGDMNYMQDGGEPDGEMAMGQLMSIMDKAEKLRQFIGEDTDLEPWVSSKLTMADDYIDGVADYMMYSEDGGMDLEVEEDGGEYSMGELEEMKKGGIPTRYKNMGFTKVGVKKKSNRKGKKWMVLAKKGDKYKVVHGGYKGMKDFSQHGSKKRKDRFWDRMGGKNSAKAKDPFSPLYWHKKFGTWQEGGQIMMGDTMELDDNEIQRLMDMGYGIEYID